MFDHRMNSDNIFSSRIFSGRRHIHLQPRNMDEDYYKVLAIPRNASKAEVQNAYRKMAAKCHPDLAGDDPKDKAKAKAKFQTVQKAYDVLYDAEKRELYDRYGSSFESMGAGGPQGSNPFAGGVDLGDINFSQLFGGRGGARGASPFEGIFRQFNQGGVDQGGAGPRRPGSRERRSSKGADVNCGVRIDFKLAVTGGKQELNVQHGNGKTETISFAVPAGIEDGKKIRLRGQGEPSPGGGKSGDLIVAVSVQSHPSFQRRGKDLIVKVPVTLAEAALGAKVDVPTPKGTITFTVPPATSSGKRLRAKGFGIQTESGEVGDLYAEIHIQLPDKLDDAAKKLIEELDGETHLDPRAELKW